MKGNISQFRTAIDRISPDIRLYLLYGADVAGAEEWASRLARSMGPQAERVDVDPSRLRADPGLLAAEAASTSLFASSRYIRVTGIGEESAEAVAMLLGAANAGNPVVALGPALKNTGKLVKLALAAPNALVMACYVPNADEAERLAIAIGQEHGLRLSRDAAAQIAAAAANDRAIMTREIEKLALFLDAAPERPMAADAQGWQAIGADLGESELWRATDALLDGRLDQLGAELNRLADAGSSAIPLLRGIVRRLITLAQLRAEMDKGATAATAIERHHIHVRERAVTARALRIWSAPKISAAIQRLGEAERATMSAGNAGNVLSDAACLAVARMARARR